MAQRGRTNIDMMRDEAPPSFQNNFTAGLKTEFTGLNFPPNAATDTDNCVFTMQGDVLRRPGFDFELNFKTNSIPSTGKAISTYRWLNAGGDGETQVLVTQVGDTLNFYESSESTIDEPISTQLLSTSVNLSVFLASGSALDPSQIECQFSDGNGYLFVYHPYCDPFFCTFSEGTVMAAVINVKIRDFAGIPDSLAVTARPTALSPEHQYNLQNQGWSSAAAWSAPSTTIVGAIIPLGGPGGPPGYRLSAGTYVFTVPAGLPITLGVTVGMSMRLDIASIQNTGFSCIGVVVGYTGTSLSLTTQGATTDALVPGGIVSETWTIVPTNGIGQIITWNSVIGNYPSNGDVWWIFKDETGAFNPVGTIEDVVIATSPAPKGSYILNAFNQDFSGISGVPGLTPISTPSRPKTGAWFQGRVWYAGVDASQNPTGDQPYYTWTESIYFSQIVTTSADFGLCYQTDDPTDENLFLLLPSDGGVINIQGSGSIFKLFPIQNGMLVFAANGVWFITGSTGIGFTANDYTITKISAVRSISSTSFVDVNGLPLFWNEEGIYAVEPAQQGLGLTVNPLTVGTIKSFYNEIPYEAKLLARGSYDPINYVVQWLYDSTGSKEVSVNTTISDCTLDPNFTDSLSTLANGNLTQTSLIPPTGNTIGIAVDIDNKLFWYYNPWTSSWNGSQPKTTTPTLGTGGLSYTVAGTLYPTVAGLSGTVTINGGNNSFVHPLPTGFTAWGAACSWDSNGIDPSNMILTNGNFTAQGFTTNVFSQFAVRSVLGHTTGKFYYEVNINSLNTSVDGLQIGFSNSSMILTNAGAKGGFNSDANGFGIGCDGNIWNLPGNAHVGNNFDYLTVFNATPSVTANRMSLGTLPRASGKYYFEGTVNVNSGGTDGLIGFGIANHNVTLSTTSVGGVGDFFGLGVDGAHYSSDGHVRVCTANDDGSDTFTVGAVIGIAADLDNKKIWFYNPTTTHWNHSSTANPATDTGGFDISAMTYLPAYPACYVSLWGGSTAQEIITMNFGATAFAHILPAGFAAWADIITVTTNFVNNYAYDKALNLNIFTKAFYPWTISTGILNNNEVPTISDIKYIQNPGGEGSPDGIFKYFSSVPDPNGAGNFLFTFSEASDPTFVDWDYATESFGLDYDSYFVTGYDLSGQGLRKFQPQYITVFSRNDIPSQYAIQGIWDYANNRSSGKWSNKQITRSSNTNFGVRFHRHKIRGHGHVLQLKFSSVDNNPFDIMGWSSVTMMSAGV